jgi:hypothetical protein
MVSGFWLLIRGFWFGFAELGFASVLVSGLALPQF